MKFEFYADQSRFGMHHRVGGSTRPGYVVQVAPSLCIYDCGRHGRRGLSAVPHAQRTLSTHTSTLDTLSNCRLAAEGVLIEDTIVCATVKFQGSRLWARRVRPQQHECPH